VPCRGDRDPLITVPCRGDRDPFITVPCRGDRDPLITVPCRGDRDPLITVPCRGDRDPLITDILYRVAQKSLDTRRLTTENLTTISPFSRLPTFQGWKTSAIRHCTRKTFRALHSQSINVSTVSVKLCLVSSDCIWAVIYKLTVMNTETTKSVILCLKN
jgi:hypothetical protein